MIVMIHDPVLSNHLIYLEMKVALEVGIPLLSQYEKILMIFFLKTLSLSIPI